MYVRKRAKNCRNAAFFYKFIIQQKPSDFNRKIDDNRFLTGFLNEYLHVIQYLFVNYFFNKLRQKINNYFSRFAPPNRFLSYLKLCSDKRVMLVL